jgi:co-chaperonin GroES (HSP10)
MALPTRLLGNRIIVRPNEAEEAMTAGGIIIPGSVRSQLEEGIVIDVAKEVEELLKPGEKVLYPRNGGVEKEYDGVKYKFLIGPTLKEAGDIWAVV